MRNRKPRAAIVATIGLSIVLAAGLRCGREKDKDDDEDERPSPELPTDWDGREDWSGSALKAVDE